MDEATRELVRDWLTRASHDLQASQVLAAANNPLLDAAIYHCQQAAEKAVKAWLQSKDYPFPKTQDLEELVEQAAKLNPDFHPTCKACVDLDAPTSPRFPIPAQRGAPTIAVSA